MEDISSKVFAQYEEKRENAARRRRARIDSVYDEIPRIKEIDAEMNMRGMKNVQNILREPSRSDEFNADLNENLDRLEKEKNELLDAHGIPRDFSKYEYECSECSDTGYTPDGKQCRCLKQSFIDEAYNSSNIKELLKKCTFKSFRMDYYSAEKGKYPDSPFNNIKRIYKRTVDFCDEFDTEGKSLFFYGTTGLGKTFLSCAAMGRLIELGKLVIYVRASKLFSIFEDNKFGRLQDRKLLDDLYNCDLLIVDDLGSEAQGKFNSAFLFDILDDRLARGKKLIINTNLDLKETGKVYSMRFTSRVMENFIVCRFYGEDIRYKSMMM